MVRGRDVLITQRSLVQVLSLATYDLGERSFRKQDRANHVRVDEIHMEISSHR